MNKWIVTVLPRDTDGAAATELLNEFDELGYYLHSTYGDAVIFGVFRHYPTIDEMIEEFGEIDEPVEPLKAGQPQDDLEVWISTQRESYGIEGKDLL